jgi:hypothetical protein
MKADAEIEPLACVTPPVPIDVLSRKAGSAAMGSSSKIWRLSIVD